MMLLIKADISNIHLGVSLVRGYLNQLEPTGEKFIPHPFSTEPGARLYKTGDLARRMADGKIEFVGRLDTQVKIRGFRVELGEIAATLSRHHAVWHNAVVLRQGEDPLPGKSLVAYIVLRRGQTVDIGELRRLLKAKLPDYMVSSTCEFLDALPLTNNGKLDRKALPAPSRARSESGRFFIAPRTPNEEIVAEIWSSVLGVEKVGAQDNFFDLGGHSLLAIQIILRLSDRFRTLLPLRMLFEKPRVEELAVEITKILIERADPTKLRRALSQLESMSDEHATHRLKAPPAIGR